ncbi:MAG: hypothetical protein ABIA93_02935 [Candidatus Woesearchaeota archaeon]
MSFRNRIGFPVTCDLGDFVREARRGRIWDLKCNIFILQEGENALYTTSTEVATENLSRYVRVVGPSSLAPPPQDEEWLSEGMRELLRDHYLTHREQLRTLTGLTRRSNGQTALRSLCLNNVPLSLPELDGLTKTPSAPHPLNTYLAAFARKTARDLPPGYNLFHKP